MITSLCAQHIHFEKDFLSSSAGGFFWRICWKSSAQTLQGYTLVTSICFMSFVLFFMRRNSWKIGFSPPLKRHPKIETSLLSSLWMVSLDNMLTSYEAVSIHCCPNLLCQVVVSSPRNHHLNEIKLYDSSSVYDLLFCTDESPCLTSLFAVGLVLISRIEAIAVIASQGTHSSSSSNWTSSKVSFGAGFFKPRCISNGDQFSWASDDIPEEFEMYVSASWQHRSAPFRIRFIRVVPLIFWCELFPSSLIKLEFSPHMCCVRRLSKCQFKSLFTVITALQKTTWFSTGVMMSPETVQGGQKLLWYDQRQRHVDHKISFVSSSPRQWHDTLVVVKNITTNLTRINCKLIVICKSLLPPSAWSLCRSCNTDLLPLSFPQLLMLWLQNVVLRWDPPRDCANSTSCRTLKIWMAHGTRTTLALAHKIKGLDANHCCMQAFKLEGQCSEVSVSFFVMWAYRSAFLTSSYGLNPFSYICHLLKFSK